MARIIFEAGDVISYVHRESTVPPDLADTKFLGVCLNEKTWIKFFWRNDDGRNGIKHPQSPIIDDIPNGAIPVVLDDSVPGDWKYMFEALILVTKTK